MKKYTLEFESVDETLNVSSVNDGFNPFELIGFLHWKIRDLELQIAGEIKPDKISRTVVKDAD